jgi:diadenosine tetraphosphate (Ap4A) HIT family hydrolase
MDCSFCDEFAQSTGETRIVARTHNRVVLPTIGSFTPGYLLYMPYEHITAFADLNQAELRECEQHINQLRSSLAAFYGPLIVAEHGPREGDLGAGCCDHAHIHLVPLPDPQRVVRASVEIGGPREPYWTLTECLSSVDEAYVYVSPASAEHYIWPATLFPRQWVRRVCAEVHRRASQWDWRDHPFDLERQQTYNALIGKTLLKSTQVSMS